MYGYVLQDWITIRGTTGGGGNASGGAGDIIQGESTWMGFSSFQDMVFWLDIREATFPGSGAMSLTWFFETSPSKDSNLFTPMPAGSGIALTSLTPGVQLPSGALPRAILSSASTTVPLATWVRWRVSPACTNAQTWDATFRILCAANRVVREAQQAF